LAKVFPNGWRQLKPDISLVNEMETLSLLEKELDDTYSVYHGVHWTNIEKHNYAIYGEIDFAVVGPSGKVLLIEQKNGTLIEVMSHVNHPNRLGHEMIANEIFKWF
jgi:cupin superfamily acireductone dioxygenase involved in methionine salvage